MYDESKNETLWEVTSENGLKVGVYRYDEGEPKFGIGPRIYTKKDGTKGYAKIGRLTYEELMWLREQMKTATTEMTFAIERDRKEAVNG